MMRSYERNPVGGVSAQSRVDRPVGALDVLTHEEWRGEGPGFRTKLTYRWLFDGRMLEAANEVLNEDGGVIARYHGAYTWDEGRGEIAFWTAAESGEVHRGRAWWRDGVLWHEAEVSGGGIAAYASALRPGAGRLEYFAAYGERRAGPELLRGEPIVYVPSRDDGESDPLQIGGEVVIRAAPADVWAALTTPDGLTGWIAPESRVELRLGGSYELYFTPDAPGRGMEGTRVLAFIPNELLATTGEAANTWSVWRLDPDSRGATRVRFTGFGTGDEWARRAAYFRGVTPGVLDRLRVRRRSGTPRHGRRQVRPVTT